MPELSSVHSSFLQFLLAAALIGCDISTNAVSNSAPIAERPPLKVNVIRVVQAENALKTEVCFGKLKPQRSGRLSFGKPGKVKSVVKNLGDKCAVDEMLAEIDQGQLDQQKVRIETNLATVQQSLQTATQGTSASLKQQIGQLQGQLKDLEARLATGHIVAPYPCIVTETNISEGTMASPSVTAFQIIEDAPPLVETSLPRRTSAQLNSEQSIWVGIGSRALVSRLKSKSPTQDAAANQRIVLEFEEELPAETWSFGQVVEIRFFVRTENSGSWLPLSALQREANGLWSAYVVEEPKEGNDDQSVVRKTVDIVQLEDDFALVTGSINENSEVIVNGGHRVVPGQSVTTVDVSQQFKAPFQRDAAE